MWLLPLKACDAPQLQLYCFPYGGAGPSLYKKWADAIDPAIQLVGVQLPGRERRIKEPAFTQMRPLVKSLAKVWRHRPDLPYAFFGHSLGALVAYELILELRRQGLPLPLRLIVSGSKAPHLNRHPEQINGLPDAAFIEAIRQLGGTPEAVLQNELLMQVFLPVLRADFTLYENYHYEQNAPIDLPILACGGRSDREVSSSDLYAWSEHTEGAFDWQLFEGDHFYLDAAPKLLIDYFTPFIQRHQNS
ncbi:MAG: thioesterase domain-containing protein [Bacteroidota bacterium]